MGRVSACAGAIAGTARVAQNASRPALRPTNALPFISNLHDSDPLDVERHPFRGGTDDEFAAALLHESATLFYAAVQFVIAALWLMMEQDQFLDPSLQG